MHRKHLLTIATLLILLSLVPSALAGGWAVVTLDELPTEVRQGQSLPLGFMVRQHGKTATNDVQPYLEARNVETGETIRITANQDGPVGHFVLEVTFPSAGSWEWSIVPAPFAGTPLAPLTVLPAVIQQVEPAPGPAAVPQPDLGRTVMRWIGLALILAASGVGAYSLRGARRPAPERS